MNLINTPYAKYILWKYLFSNPIDDCMFNFLSSGESLQQNGTNTNVTQEKSSFHQQLEPMQVPKNDLSTSPVQWEEAAAQESPRTSSKSDHLSEGTLATTDPDNKDFGGDEELATEAGSAAVTNTPGRAETGERQREDIALKVKQLNHVNLKLY